MRAIGEAVERYAILRRIPAWENVVGEDIGSCGDFPESSNGIAFAPTAEEALSRAFSELVERHVVLDAWLRRTPIFKLGISHWMAAFARLNAWANGAESFVLAFPNSFFNVLCTVIVSPRPPFLVFGFGSASTSRHAFEKSFLEAWRLFWDYRGKKRENDRELSISSEDVTSCWDHLLFYATNQIPLSNVFTIKDLGLFSSPVRTGAPVVGVWGVSQCHGRVLDMRSIGLSGYCGWASSPLFIPYYVGPLKQAKSTRRQGEVHPIA